MSRLRKILKINQDALKFIDKFTPASNGIDFVNNAEIAARIKPGSVNDFDTEELERLPTASKFNKQGLYEEFKVIRLERSLKDKSVVVVLFGIGEGNFHEIKKIPVNELFGNEPAEVADFLDDAVVVK